MLPVAVNVPADCAIATGPWPPIPNNKSEKTRLVFISSLQKSLHTEFARESRRRSRGLPAAAHRYCTGLLTDAPGIHARLTWMHTVPSSISDRTPHFTS